MVPFFIQKRPAALPLYFMAASFGGVEILSTSSSLRALWPLMVSLAPWYDNVIGTLVGFTWQVKAAWAAAGKAIIAAAIGQHRPLDLHQPFAHGSRVQANYLRRRSLPDRQVRRPARHGALPLHFRDDVLEPDFLLRARQYQAG